ncbi:MULTISPECIES: Nif3-like dinuclear metal center hexameric protein [unclassified Cellulophaga]|uniref:Nif3-like dinuclear metal center hexameric protein n=2 Tax=Pseudomonadati TaxID=3379134 RepID=UPI0026E325AF|nr:MULTISPECIES: Nif3-like dinuclear metal center hexameric protein [unclassified Cellulophaga]MDO6492803.1 Nif3-like dinuclear metal center hexameric protein [Cellulophaga sp. 2_MG-2023]MDO6496237.1 Nif3-like dinuclear metal center hexameric protein [Cellulophaga sp. 3_MG-2023]
MTVKEITNIIEDFAPLNYAEDFDNVGLLIGNATTKVTGVLVTLDTLENVVDEAIAKNCNLIVSFHPIIFSGLKKITGANYVERVVLKAIKNDIAIYSMHTALDNSNKGVNAKICEVLGLTNTKILIPQKGTIKKLTTYVPKKEAAELKEVLFAAGVGNIGNYSNCSFTTIGTGSFKPNEKANPTIGEIGKTQTEEEVQINVTFEKAKEKKILQALFKNHSYEEVAYEITTLENTNQNIGMGMVGELENPVNETKFLQDLKIKMNADCVRHSNLLNKKIKKVAVLGGSGSFAINAAKAVNADVFITADLKYHQFYEAENKILLADIGHFETEQFTKNLLVEILTKKIPNFAVSLSESITNPIKYF